jgi:Zn-finger nucleic acid-binding protein
MESDLEEKIKLLEEENKVLKERLSKYANPKVSQKKYYEKNKEKILARNSEYKKRKKLKDECV